MSAVLGRASAELDLAVARASPFSDQLVAFDAEAVAEPPGSFVIGEHSFSHA